MPDTNATEVKMEQHQLRLSVKTNFIFSPIDPGQLQEGLVKRGYEALPLRASQIAAGRIDVIGSIARKKDNEVTFDSNRQVIGVNGASPAETLSSFNDIYQIIAEELHIDLSGSSVRFYETIVDYVLATGRNPRQVLGELSSLRDLSNRISSAVGVDVSLFGFRVGSKDVVPNREEWLDIKFEPIIAKADKEYFMQIVFRSPEKDRVSNFLGSIENTVKTLIQLLESA